MLHCLLSEVTGAGSFEGRFESMKRGNTTRSTFSYSSERKGANLRHANSTPMCWTKCQILEEKTVMRPKEGTQSPGKRNMVEGSSKTLVGRAAVMLLIPAPAGAHIGASRFGPVLPGESRAVLEGGSRL